MSNRCPDCGKMASLESEEPEVETEEVNGEGAWSVEVVLRRNSVCCGAEMKEGRFSFDGDVAEEAKAHWDSNHGDLAEDEEMDLGIAVEAEATERAETTNPKTGKPIPFCYQRSFYGVEATVTISCGSCGETIHTETFTDELQASAFDELN